MVFKENVHSQDIINQPVTIAEGVEGTAEVDTSAVSHRIDFDSAVSFGYSLHTADFYAAARSARRNETGKTLAANQ